MSRLSTVSSPTTTPQCRTFGGMTSRPPGLQPRDGLADMEIDLAGENVDDLLVRMMMRTRLVAGLQTVQRHSCAVAGKGLALDAVAHALPGRLLPIDRMDVHRLRLPALLMSAPKPPPPGVSSNTASPGFIDILRASENGFPLTRKRPCARRLAAVEAVRTAIEPARHRIEQPRMLRTHVKLDHLPVAAARAALAAGAAPELAPVEDDRHRRFQHLNRHGRNAGRIAGGARPRLGRRARPCRPNS